jgi:radical SAM superfamily enzyme YgiQ (UPF0313 family)
MLALGMRLPGLRARADAIARLPALSLLTLAGMTPPHWTCSYHDEPASEGLVEKVIQERPTLVAVSALTASVEEAYRFSADLRHAGIPVVLGGLHATACPDEVQQHCDALVIGEGEPVWPTLLADAEPKRLQPVYRAQMPFDLAESPVPRFDLLGTRPRPRLTVQTQRGCPLACEFCAASRMLGPFREKPVANVRRELEAIVQQVPQPVLEFADDNTFVERRDADALLDTFAASGARYFTEVDWRVGERPEVLNRLAQSGCVQMLVGVESMVFRPPGMGPKLAPLERIMDALCAIQEAGVVALGCFVVGCDGETRRSINQLADFLLTCPLADVQITLQTPFPGTALRRRLERQGRLLPGRGWAYHTLFDVTYQPDAMPVEELEIAFRELIQRVYSEEASQRRAKIRRNVWHKNPKFSSWESEPFSIS